MVNESYAITGPLPRWNTRFNAASQTFIMQGLQTFTDVSTSTTVPTYKGDYFTLAGLGTIGTNLAAVFDQYRVVLLELWAQPGFNTIAETASDSAIWATGVDFDNAANPSTANEVVLKAGAIVTPLAAGHYHKWRPQVATAVYNGAFTGYADHDDQPWLDCANTNIQLYGMKLYADVTNNVIPIKYFVRFTVEFRGIAG